MPAALVAAVFLVWTVAVAMDENDKDLFPPALPAIVGIAAMLLAVVFLRTGRNGRAFAMTGVGAIAVVATLFVSLYPRVMVSDPDFGNSLTVDGAASSHYALQVMSVVALIFVPLVARCIRDGRTTSSASGSATSLWCPRPLWPGDRDSNTEAAPAGRVGPAPRVGA